MNSNSECEIQVAKDGKLEWQSISVTDVLARESKERKRCPECHGKVRVHKDGEGSTSPAHFEHMPNHPGCSLSYKFDGTKRPHPNPEI